MIYLYKVILTLVRDSSKEAVARTQWVRGSGAALPPSVWNTRNVHQPPPVLSGASALDNFITHYRLFETASYLLYTIIEYSASEITTIRLSHNQTSSEFLKYFNSNQCVRLLFLDICKYLSSTASGTRRCWAPTISDYTLHQNRTRIFEYLTGNNQNNIILEFLFQTFCVYYFI